MIGFRNYAAICAAIVAIAAGCVPEKNVLSNDRIIDEVKKCETAGLSATIEYWHFSTKEYPRNVTCQPKQPCAVVIKEKE